LEVSEARLQQTLLSAASALFRAPLTNNEIENPCSGRASDLVASIRRPVELRFKA